MFWWNERTQLKGSNLINCDKSLGVPRVRFLPSLHVKTPLKTGLSSLWASKVPTEQ